MGKIKCVKINLSLRKSLILYIIAFTILALFLSAETFSICDKAAENIRISYPFSGEKYYLTNEQGEQLGEGVYIGKGSAPMSEQDERAMVFLDIFPRIAVPIYSALCIIAAALLFYRNKLKKPIAALRAASEKIANSDLDFSIDYDGKDELGRLCASFEIMRATLADNFSQMWRQVEDRKTLNAAFAHDLRTPLTILKGYNEILQASEHAQTREVAATMGKNIVRIETYVNDMSRLQRLEDIQPDYQQTDLQAFLSSLREGAEMVCQKNGKKLYWKNETAPISLFIDAELISQTISNLIANAVRYAHTKVTVSIVLEHNNLYFSITDDGKGFDKSALQKALKPYFTGEENRAEHFGLGLYICKLLCERCGGRLQIENTQKGAKATAFFKIPDLIDKK